MDRKTILRATLGILGTVLIGAIGSGVWEHILQPALSWTRDSVLNVASLGIETFKDDTYREIAQGFREAASGQVYFLLVLLYVMVLTAMLVIIWHLAKETRRKWQELLDRIAQAKEHGSKEPPSIEDLEREAIALEPRFTRIYRLNYALAAVVVLTVASNLITYARNSYVSAAVSHYHQAMRIAAPYLTPTEEKEIASAFSQVSRKTDYVAVLRKLEGVASAHGQRVPKFRPW